MFNNYRTDLQLDISLVYEERAGDIIFLIGTIIAIVSTYQVEQSIIDKLFMIKSSEKMKVDEIEEWKFGIYAGPS